MESGHSMENNGELWNVIGRYVNLVLISGNDSHTDSGSEHSGGDRGVSNNNNVTVTVNGKQERTCDEKMLVCHL